MSDITDNGPITPVVLTYMDIIEVIGGIGDGTELVMIEYEDNIGLKRIGIHPCQLDEFVSSLISFKAKFDRSRDPINLKEHDE